MILKEARFSSIETMIFLFFLEIVGKKRYNHFADFNAKVTVKLIESTF